MANLNIATSAHELKLESLFGRRRAQQPTSLLSQSSIDQTYQKRMSSYIREYNLTLDQTIRLVRGQTDADTRPNKALLPTTYEALLCGYEHQRLLIDIAYNGYKAEWKHSRTNPTWPDNHQSAQAFSASVLKSIAAGQDAGEYLIVDPDILKRWNIQVSLFGAVPKSGVDPQVEVRVIHDLSFPIRHSTNDATNQSALPVVPYTSVKELAIRIEAEYKRIQESANPNTRIKICKGDVKGAFRHLRIQETDAIWMGGAFTDQNARIIDMSAPFGWTGSPSFYAVFGRAISLIVSRESPASMHPGNCDHRPFFAYEWVDDHILIEADEGDRCLIASDTLRLAMMSILGPKAINESKFSSWNESLVALGLEWDCINRTVSMPVQKIIKALGRVTSALEAKRLSLKQLQELLGSLSHVCLCVRSAKPFYQNLQSKCKSRSRYQVISLGSGELDDLKWFDIILRVGRLRGVPTSLFSELPSPDVHLYVDASDEGLAVLDPSGKRFIRCSFDHDELKSIASGEFDFNIREKFSIALAAFIFAPSWHNLFCPRIPHVKFWSDNTSSVARSNSLGSYHRFSKELNRSIGLIEAVYGIRISAEHIPGVANVLADAGSRPRNRALNKLFDDFCSDWVRVQVPAQLRHLYKNFSTLFDQNLWPTVKEENTLPRGNNGVSGVAPMALRCGCRHELTTIMSTWRCLQLFVGSQEQVEKEIVQTPCCPRYATYLGVIKWPSGTPLLSHPAINLLCEGCSGCLRLRAENNQSRSKSLEQCLIPSTSTSPMTASCGGLRFWTSSLC